MAIISNGDIIQSIQNPHITGIVIGARGFNSGGKIDVYYLVRKLVGKTLIHASDAKLVKKGA
jgi:hypothetical protein